MNFTNMPELDWKYDYAAVWFLNFFFYAFGRALRGVVRLYRTKSGQSQEEVSWLVAETTR